MKYSVLAYTALALIVQALPVPSTAATVTLTPLGPKHVGTMSIADRCNRPAAIDGDEYADLPTIALLQGATGIAQVRIDLAATGALEREMLFSGSGNPWLDGTALSSAKSAKFTPEIVNCSPVAGSYLYEVDF